MARLKVKQISDFTTAVQGLIDNDADQNAAIISAISSEADAVSSALVSEINATNGDVSSIDLKQVSQDSRMTGIETDVASAADNADVTAVSNALGAEILTTNSEITALEGDVSSIDLKQVSQDSRMTGIETDVASAADNADLTAVSNALGAEILTTNAEISALQAKDGSSDTRFGSVDTRFGSSDTRQVANEGDIAANSTAVSAIVAGADVNLDQFAEVIAYVNSLDSADDNFLAGQVSSINLRISNDEDGLIAEIAATNGDVSSIDLKQTSQDDRMADMEAYDVALSGELAAEIVATNADVDSIDLVLTGVGTTAYTDAVSAELAAEIRATNTEVTSLDTYIDDVSADLAAEIVATNADVASLALVDAALEGQTTYLKLGGLPASPTSFRLQTGVKFGTNDDLSVFINGLEVHQTGIAYVDGVGGEFEAAVEATTEGYNTVDGMTFTLVGIGYDLEADDHIHVIGVQA